MADDRLEVRLPPGAKQLQEAADAEEVQLSDFVRVAALEEAMRVLRASLGCTYLDREAYDALARDLAAPPETSERSIAAVRRAHRGVLDRG
ncbi:DUF1778 domain-containing protein (plasmid) [Embleya sp. NBC_00888]|uniref:type II toxin -antitoxin system TacA 1-like antitoxin n=1 Tax=Embleya sp. NBC_00888 TaxID=2975960 RepID=UPI002F913DF3|nr:DUF1778 domain-containing protein [Embleya sp. NBC_00888]